MKNRGIDLRKHRKQMFDYWVRLVPGRPRYAVLCNFDQFAVYDFDRQVDEPVAGVTLAELPDRWGPLAFLYARDDRPIGPLHRVRRSNEEAHLLLCRPRDSTG